MEEPFLQSGRNSISKGYGCKHKIWWGRKGEGLYFVASINRCTLRKAHRTVAQLQLLDTRGRDQS